VNPSVSDYKLLALDVDGTLVRNGDVSRVAESAMPLWLMALRELGLDTTLATGRHIHSSVVQTLIRLLQIQAPLVTLNGAEVWRPNGELLARHPVPTAAVRGLERLVTEEKVPCLGFTVTGMVPREDFPSAFRYQPTQGWLKFVLFPESKASGEGLRQRLAAEVGLEVSSSAEDNIEVTQAGVHKASGLAVVCHALCIAPEQVIAMGDGENDLPMLRSVGLGFRVIPPL